MQTSPRVVAQSSQPATLGLIFFSAQRAPLRTTEAMRHLPGRDLGLRQAAALPAPSRHGEMTEWSKVCDSSESLLAFASSVFSSPKGGGGSNPPLVNIFPHFLHVRARYWDGLNFVTNKESVRSVSAP